MAERKAGKKVPNDKLIESLLKDPTRSIREIARDLDCYRQTVWRKKKEMERSHVVWGYTAVIDETRLDRTVYMILMKTRPMTDSMATTMIERIETDMPGKLGVRLIDVFHLNGEYDWILRFSSPDHTTARKYYDTLRMVYADNLLEKPVLVDLNFVLVAEGKTNPDLRQLREFVPTI
jgi:DNA-binding Lrp family transcriptional regulator